MNTWNEIIYTLKEANQYEEVQKILLCILLDQETTVPVGLYLDENSEPSRRISMEKVKRDAAKLLYVLHGSDCCANKETFEYLQNLINDRLDVRLHNYANAISHRKTPDDDMDQIRSMCVLSNLLDCLSIPDGKWRIPNGWKLKKTHRRLFSAVESWHDSAGYYAVMPINYADKDCYIMLDSDDTFGIFDNHALDPFMDEDMLLTGSIHDYDIDFQIKIYLKMLKLLRDMYR